MKFFENYKCPNGLPPEECKHAPQLVANVANYFSKKREQAQAQNKEASKAKNVIHTRLEPSPTMRTRSRG